MAAIFVETVRSPTVDAVHVGRRRGAVSRRCAGPRPRWRRAAAPARPGGTGRWPATAACSPWLPPTTGPWGARPWTPPSWAWRPDPWTGGYWEVASDGGVFAFNAPFFGSMGGTAPQRPHRGHRGRRRHRWLLGGGPRRRRVRLPRAVLRVHGGHAPRRPHRGHRRRPRHRGATGRWRSDGGVFAFHAPFFGSMGGRRLDAPIVGIALDPWTGGYWEVAPATAGCSPSTRRSSGPWAGPRSPRPSWGSRRTPAAGGTGRSPATAGSSASTRPFFGSDGGDAPARPRRGHRPLRRAPRVEVRTRRGCRPPSAAWRRGGGWG